MESSLFNVFVPAKKGYCLYNTLHESVLFCDEELKEALQTNVESINAEFLPTLKSYGVIVDNPRDELDLLQFRYNSRLFNTRETQFVVVTTYQCNLACPYCYEGKGEVYSRNMSMEMADTILHVIQNRIIQQQSQNVTLILFGGEPLLNLETGEHIGKTLKEWCQSHNRRLRTFMVTNGTLLTKEKAEVIKEYVDGVQLTFDGSQPFHDTTRIHKDGKGTYTEVFSAVKSALNAGMGVSLRIQVSKENCLNLKELFFDIQPLMATGRVTVNIAPLSRYSGMCSSYSSHFLEKEERETVLPAMLSFTPDVTPSPQYLPCVAYTNNLIFDGNGDIYRCITTVGEDQRIGHLEGETIVWEPELYTFLGRDPLALDQCKTCEYLPLCGGGCPRTAYLEHDTYQSSVCGGSRFVLHEHINLFLRRRFPDRF
jgi:uncharacterized protein